MCVGVCVLCVYVCGCVCGEGEGVCVCSGEVEGVYEDLVIRKEGKYSMPELLSL